ncbi:hypothetical protein [Halorubrum sp. Atlit-26R]|uniref:hypothetical protein n=1 Tax=Halorubrum sp. Atlit-26R TaxID=2282128 RepID=UPI0011C3D6B8|nr:hypothetical protein [Halorubrum sp. Atlit-26R]
MTTQGANLKQAERTGRNNNIIQPKGSGNTGGSNVAELSRSEIEELDPETDIVVEELEGGNPRIRERKEDERYIKADLDSNKVQKFFTDDEIEELQDRERTLKGESEPEDIDEVWDGIREGVRKHNKEVAKNKKELEKERIREAYRDPVMDRKVRDMTGEMLQRVMSDDNSSHVDEAELQEALETVEERYSSFLEESEPEIKDPSTEIEELDEGLEAWKDSDKEYWHDFVEDLNQSSTKSMYESVGPNSKRVTTQDEELMHALRNYRSEPFDGEVEIEKDSGSTVIAVVRED